jgi:hypothetical protein
MRRWGQGGALLLAIGAFAACVPEKGVGYVEIRTFPKFSGPLFLDTTRVAGDENGAALISHSVGRTMLQFQRNGQFVPICEFEVRKNRIVTVTVSALERNPRCAVRS